MVNFRWIDGEVNGTKNPKKAQKESIRSLLPKKLHLKSLKTTVTFGKSKPSTKYPRFQSRRKVTPQVSEIKKTFSV